MPLPAITDFTAAVQNPAVCFNDAELAGGMVELHPARGTPMVYSGNFAAVYPVTASDGTKYAVRCFTREVNEPEKRRERYQRLSNFFDLIKSPAFVDYRYLEEGIRVRGEWYPTIRMEWVEGSRLDQFVEANLGRPELIREVCGQLLKVNQDMKTLYIAHNDLQHGNLMVQANGNIRLVDYDGFFLPLFQGQPSPELGHAQFQHPLRKVGDYGPYVDNFPVLVLYLSLMALSVDTSLWQRFYTQDNLILTSKDYSDPANSDCFRALKNSPDASVRHLVNYLEGCCSIPVDEVRDLQEILSSAPAPSTPVASPPAPVITPSQSTGTGSDYRNLLQMGQVVAPAPAIAPAVPASTPLPVAAAQTILCPQCNLANSVALIFCDDERCFAELQPGRRFCNHCGLGIPVKAVFCHGCGCQLS